MNNKETTEKTVPKEVVKLQETLDYILELSEKEIQEYLVKQFQKVEEETEILINDITEDILLEYLNPEEILIVEQDTTENVEWVNSLKSACYSEIATKLVYIALYKIIISTKKEDILSAVKSAISNYDSSEDIKKVTDDTYYSFEESFSNFKDSILIQAVMEEVEKIRSSGMDAKITVQPVIRDVNQEDNDKNNNFGA